MFGGWTSLDLTEKEREPPSDPTPLQFPRCSVSSPARPLTRESLQDLGGLLIGVRKPQDISKAHLEALNLNVERDVPILSLIPEPLKTLKSPSHTINFPLDNTVVTAPSSPDQTSSSPSPKLSNGYPSPDRKAYEGLKAELQFPNDAAFREVCRMAPRAGHDKPRITQSRRFWLGLERMSQYWDTSADVYYEVPDAKKDTKMKDSAVVVDAENQAYDNHPTNDNELSSETKTKPETKLVYKGRRISTGADMPEDHRDETVRRLLEMVAWPFRCQVVVPGVAPRLAVGNVLFPVRHTFTAGRSPSDTQVARKGILEGPLMGVQCRGETVFRNAADEYERGGEGPVQTEQLDLFREVGGMLLLAQERAREGREEKRSGEGKWWTSVPRWGGGPGGEMESTNPSTTEGVPGGGTGSAAAIGGEILPPATGESEAAKNAARPLLQERPMAKRARGSGTAPHGLALGPGSGPSAANRRLSMAERWKLVQPGPSTWDKKAKYLRVGKDPRVDEDDIYLLSSLNHHVSLLRLRVPPKYLDWLSSYPSPNPNSNSSFPPDSNDNELLGINLQRTRWFDLFDSGDRVEVFEGLWRVVGWLMRGEERADSVRPPKTSTEQLIQNIIIRRDLKLSLVKQASMGTFMAELELEFEFEFEEEWEFMKRKSKNGKRKRGKQKGETGLRYLAA
ncbi:MAG: hypothetical protein Q9160_007090 [Pyrenula sp. 1 TL-2023]